MSELFTSNELDNSKQDQDKSGALGVLFLAVFIDLLGFGIVIPLLPFWAKNLQATDFTYGILVSIYSMMQFVFAPLWGRISDKRGRRPVILIGLTGSIIGFSILAIANSLIMLFVARIIAGIFTAATLPTSQAYISDTTTGADRAKGFGLIGAAFGLGFALGPGIGGVLFIFGGYALSALFAAGLAVVNLLLAIRILPESLTRNIREERTKYRASKERISRFEILDTLFKNPTILVLIVIFSVVGLAFSNFEATLALFGRERFGLDEAQAGILFLIVGIVIIIVQGGFIRPLANRFAEPVLITVGLVFLTLGFIGLSTVYSLQAMVFWTIPVAIGSSVANPTLGSFLSKKAPPERQGEILGINQGMGSLMRIVGPLWGTFVLDINTAYPFYTGAALLAVAVVVATILMVSIRERIPGITICLNCGVRLQEGAAYCSQCGFSVPS